MLRLFAYGVLYVSILAIGRMLPGVLLGRLLIDWKGILLLLYLIVLLSLWLFEMTLFGNIISIVCGSYIGVSFTCGLQILAVLSLAWIDVDHLKGAEIQKLIWNQNAYLILGWNRFPGYDSELFRNIKYSLSPQYGCFYFIGIIGIIIAAGLFMIQRIDLLDNNKED